MGCVGKQQVSPARSKTYQRDGFAKFSLANGLENDSRQGSFFVFVDFFRSNGNLKKDCTFTYMQYTK